MVQAALASVLGIQTNCFKKAIYSPILGFSDSQGTVDLFSKKQTFPDIIPTDNTAELNEECNYEYWPCCVSASINAATLTCPFSWLSFP